MTINDLKTRAEATHITPSSIVIDTGWTTGDGIFFFAVFTPYREPTQLPMQRVPGFFPWGGGVKASGT